MVNNNISNGFNKILAENKKYDKISSLYSKIQSPALMAVTMHTLVDDEGAFKLVGRDVVGVKEVHKLGRCRCCGAVVSKLKRSNLYVFES